MIKSSKIILAFGIILALILIFQQNLHFDATGDALKIGAILPLTGDLAYVGQEMQRGMGLALQEADNPNIKIIYEDDLTFDIKSSVNAANKLVNLDKVDVVFQLRS